MAFQHTSSTIFSLEESSKQSIGVDAVPSPVKYNFQRLEHTKSPFDIAKKVPELVGMNLQGSILPTMTVREQNVQSGFAINFCIFGEMDYAIMDIHG